MKKILYIMVLILAVTAVLSAAGCAEKAQSTENDIQGVSGQVTPAMTPAAMNGTGSPSSKVVDVVCKMKVEKTVIDTSVYKGKTYYFCSPYCKTEFDKNPEKYINSQNST